MPRAGYTGIIEEHPNTQTMRFGGKWLNLSAIAAATGTKQPELSRIFNGQRKPCIETAMKVAAVLQMTLDDFYSAMADKIEENAKMRARLDSYAVKGHFSRLEREDKADLKTYKSGHFAAP